MKAVCDSTVLIGLAKIGRLELLGQLFYEVFVPGKVYDEVVVRGKGKPGAKEVADAGWIKRAEVHDFQTVRMLSSHMGAGEAEVLVLGREFSADWLVIDELRRKGFRIDEAVYKQALDMAGE